MTNPTAARLANSPLLTSQLTFAEQPAPAGADAAKKAPELTGWDPYEVWRTRVLLPRLSDRSPAEDLSQQILSRTD
jgi:hypothetical protein